MKSPPRRLSRQEQQRQTRDRLLDTAETLFAEGGINATSLRSLCESAGFSQGAFYSNFSGKEDLLLSVLQRHIEHEAKLLLDLAEETIGDTLEDALEKLSSRLAQISQDTQWSLLAVELQLQARRDSQFAAQCADTRKASYAALASVLDLLKAQFSLDFKIPSVQLAISLYALWSGLVLCGPADNTLTRDQVLLIFLKGVIAPQTRH